MKVYGLCKLTSDSIRKYGKNTCFLHFSIASFRNKHREGTQDVDYFDAEYIMKNPESNLDTRLIKGTELYISNAELRNDEFIDNYGIKKSKMKLLIYSFVFLTKQGAN